MENKRFVELFKKDCEYYDKEKKELSGILSLVKFKENDRLIDIGAGTGRLSIPLSKYVSVTALDSNESLLDQINDKNIEKIHKKIEGVYPREKFDYGLIAWPQFNNFDEVFGHVKNHVLKEGGKLIVIKSLHHEYKDITKKLFLRSFEEDKPSFLEVLSKYFKVEKEKIVGTQWVYPNLKTALEMALFEISAFYDKNLDKKQEKVLIDFLREREKNNKVYLESKVKILLLK